MIVVNARMLHKRDVTPSAQQLIADMGKTASQCTVAANSVSYIAI
jgi:hypothetical protein